jgi:hypothetical protein
MQEGRFFQGYYGCYCYLPLYVFCGRHLLVAQLGRADMDEAAGAVEEAARVIARIRTCWPRTRIVLRGDAGFARDELMAWCEAHAVDFLFGLGRNARLLAEITAELDRAAARSRRSGRPERCFESFMWTTRESRSRPRRIVAKAEWTQGEANPRFVVTSLTRRQCKTRHLYEKVYCARGEMENRIKECQLDIFADRTSAATMRANQLRLWLHSMAYVLLCASHRPPRHRSRRRHLRHHPSQAAQDRRAGQHQRPPYQGRDGIELSGRAKLGHRRRQARARGARARLARMTRHAAPHASQRGIIPRTSEINCRCPRGSSNPSPPRVAVTPAHQIPAHLASQ